MKKMQISYVKSEEKRPVASNHLSHFRKSTTPLSRTRKRLKSTLAHQQLEQHLRKA
jgi:hypothetical protein